MGGREDGAEAVADAFAAFRDVDGEAEPARDAGMEVMMGGGGGGG